MPRIFHIYLFFIFVSFAQSQNLSSTSVQGAFGSVTIDGKIWNQVALRPIIPIGKVSLALDIVFYIDQDGNIYDDEWDFSNGKKSKNSRDIILSRLTKNISSPVLFWDSPGNNVDSNKGGISIFKIKRNKLLVKK